MKKEIRTQIWTTGVSYLSAKNSRCSLLSVPALLLGGSQLQDICSVLASVGTAHMYPPPPTQKASELWPQTTPKASSLTQKREWVYACAYALKTLPGLKEPSFWLEEIFPCYLLRLGDL